MTKPARRLFRVWYDDRQGVKSLFQVNPDVNHLKEEFKVIETFPGDVILTREEAEKMLSSLSRASTEFGTSAFHGGIYEAKEILEAAMKENK